MEGQTEAPLEEEPTPREAGGVEPNENENWQGPEDSQLSGPIATAILVQNTQKQKLKETSEAMTLSILKRRDEFFTEQAALKQKFLENAKKENTKATKKLAVLTKNRELLKKKVEYDENIAKHLNSSVQNLRKNSKSLIEDWKPFTQKCNQLNEKVLKLQEHKANIAANEKLYDQSMNRKTAELNKIQKIQISINETMKKTQRSIAWTKHLYNDEAVNIQNLTDKKVKNSQTLFSKKEQLTVVKNQIGNEKEKLDRKDTLYLKVEENNAKLNELELEISAYDEKITLLTKQNEVNNITATNNANTVEKLKESMKLMENNVEIAKSFLENLVQETSNESKALMDRYEARHKDFMNLSVQIDEKNKILLEPKENLLRLTQEKHSLQLQKLTQQKTENLKLRKELHLESRQKRLEEISEFSKKLTEQTEKLKTDITDDLFKINNEKKKLVVDIKYSSDMQNNFKEKVERMKVRKAKLQAEKEQTLKKISDTELKIRDLKKRIIKGECVRPGILKRPQASTPQKQVQFGSSTDQKSTTNQESSTRTSKSQITDLRTTAEKLFDQLKESSLKE